MQKLVKEYLNELNRRQRKRRRAGIALMLLVVMVFGGVVGILTQYGIAMTEDAKCGIEEHTHTDECYQDVLVCGREEGEGHQHGEECYQTENVLVCGQEEREGHTHTEGCYQEDGTLICGQEESEGHQHGEACYESRKSLVCGQEESEAHVHAEGCYERQLVCGKEEHTHTENCRIDRDADVEDASKWDAQYASVSWTGNWGEDLVMAAQKQLGYKESMDNYQIAENGGHKGYTRYGQFMGDVYADWDAAFVNFCLHYARLDNTGMFANEKDAAKWHERIANGANAGYLTAADGYGPQAGDIVFFRRDGEETDTQMGIVSSYNNENNEIKVIEGNSGNEVKENKYAANDGHIFAYLKVTEMERAYKHIGENAAGTEGTEPGAEGVENGNPGTEGTENGNSGAEGADAVNPEGVENAGSGDEDAEPGTENDEAGKQENGEAGTDDGGLGAEDDANADDEEIPAAVVEELEKSPAYEASHEDDMGTIHVAAGEGTIPEGAQLSVKKIEPVMTTADLDDEETVQAKEINDQYELTAKKLQEESEKNNTTLEGFLAYDISFLVDGVEVEPNGPVKVTMDFNEAVKPEGVSENATVAVNHLKEDKTAEDGIVVEDLTEKAATTITTKEEEAAVEKVELVTGTFSVFSISWTVPGNVISMRVEHINEDRQPVDVGASGSISIEPMSGTEYDLYKLLDVETVDKGDYHYEPIKVLFCSGVSPEMSNGVEVSSVRVKTEDNGVFSFSTWIFCDSELKIVHEADMNEMTSYAPWFQVVYRVTERTVKLGLKIDDRIMEEGNLKAGFLESGNESEGEETLESQYGQRLLNEADESVRCVWYKKVNGGTETAVARTPYDNGNYNVSKKGDWLNVALDGGALNKSRSKVEYRVELQVDGQPIATSDYFSVSYYDEIQNGSFEENRVQGNKNDTSESNDGTWVYLGQEHVTGWNTTAGDRQIELAVVFGSGEISNLYTSKTDYVGKKNWFYAADGDQFAELNCTQTGALYQDVLVAKGVPLYYSFAHRGRPNSGNRGSDTMTLLIVPTVVAKGGIKDCNEHTHSGEIDTQEEVECLLRHLNDTDTNGNKLYPGVYYEECTATVTEWTRHEGDYVPEYNLNRFFFVSTVTTSPHEANFLDDISFSQTLPKPKEEGTFNFRIEKIIRGLDVKAENKLLETIGDLKFVISMKDGSALPNGLDSELVASGMNWSYNSATGSWIGEKNYEVKVLDDKTYSISVTEQGESVGSYKCDTKVTELTSSVSSVLSDEELSGDKGATQGTETSDTQGTVTKTGTVSVSQNMSKGLRFLNTYSSQEVTYDWKVVKHSSTGETAYISDAVFKLMPESGGEALTAKSDENGVVQWDADKVKSLNGTYILSEESVPGGYIKTEERLTLTFKNGKLQSVPNADGKSHIKVTVTQTECTIFVKNDVEYYELPSTGGAGIYLYMFGGVLLMAAAVLITYRNKRREVLRS